jgi:hypothetical protein
MLEICHVQESEDTFYFASSGLDRDRAETDKKTNLGFWNTFIFTEEFQRY